MSDRTLKGNKNRAFPLKFSGQNSEGNGNLVRVINELITLARFFRNLRRRSTKEGSLDLLKTQTKRPDDRHFAGYGLGPEEIVDVLDKNQGRG